MSPSPSVTVESDYTYLEEVIDMFAGALITYGYLYENVCEFINTEKFNEESLATWLQSRASQTSNKKGVKQ